MANMSCSSDKQVCSHTPKSNPASSWVSIVTGHAKSSSPAVTSESNKNTDPKTTQSKKNTDPGTTQSNKTSEKASTQLIPTKMTVIATGCEFHDAKDALTNELMMKSYVEAANPIAVTYVTFKDTGRLCEMWPNQTCETVSRQKTECVQVWCYLVPNRTTKKP